MNNSDQDRLDQRSNSATEDSTSMTIEFLRARLLAERSVSKSARQRADELAKRVAELEEQLRIVSLQRMKAEKATADVLAILESNGMSDVSETFDSSSDEDTPHGSKVGNKFSKEEEDSVNSKVRKNEPEELSGSDFDSRAVTGRSLSWKGRKDGSRSSEKYKDPSLRRRSSFASPGSSPRHRPGKSCRKVRGKESRSSTEEFRDNSLETNSQENGVSNSVDVFPNCSDDYPKTPARVTESEEEKTLRKGPLSGRVENGHDASSNGHAYPVYGSNGDMEKALQQQAQLIGQYEAMEKAQREWEEKFRENNSSTPDSCDPGNRSDVTEERFEVRAQGSHPSDTMITQTQDTKSHVGDLYRTGAKDILSPSHDVRRLKEQKNTSTYASESPTQDFAFPVEKGKQNQERFGSNYRPQLHSSDHHPYQQHSHGSHDSPRSQSASSFPSNVDGGFSKGEASRSQNELYALVPHEAPNELGGILHALRQARQSLQDKINTLPLAEARYVGKRVEPSVPTTIPEDKVEAPVGYAGLFRLPTDFSAEASYKAEILNPSARLSLGNYYPDTGFASAPSSHFASSPYLERSRSSFPAGDRHLGSPYVEGGSRLSSQKPYFDPYLDTGLPSSSRYPYPNHPVSSSYPDLMPRVPSREGLSTFVPRMSGGMPPTDHFSFSSDHVRPNMYR
ncbi:hypothetical protein Tsubulata_034599 [Turnera subulata]|uniref:Uncharacterized protein n=1 Tax=Turnera subulata TaxID=218843 RepID=A0A9Q0JJC1_9ROSI|nr:hypothetical protein Tsubulata_034599 [Turnera subulata]